MTSSGSRDYTRVGEDGSTPVASVEDVVQNPAKFWKRGFDSTFTAEDRLFLIQRVAQQMLSLHSEQIAGFEFRPHKVMVSRDSIELSQRKEEADEKLIKYQHNEAVRMLLYKAPECIRGFDTTDTAAAKQADIWGFACLCLYIATGRDPQLHRDGKHLLNQGENAFVTIALLVGKGQCRPEFQRFCNRSPAWENFFQACFQNNPKDRPNAEELYGHFLPLCAQENIVPAWSLPDDDEKSSLGYSGEYPSEQQINLGRDMRNKTVLLDLQEIRQCISTVLNAAASRPFNEPCHGGIFLENITYQLSDTGNGTASRVTFALGEPKVTTQLWRRWITVQSTNIPYVPPEESRSRGNPSKADSWAVGCLLTQLLNSGKPLRLRRQWRNARVAEYFNTGQEAVLSQLKDFNIGQEAADSRLKEFYDGAGQEQGLIVGPELILADTVPYACEDFLALCLELNPAERWNLEDLQSHPFVDLNISIPELFKLDELYYEELPPTKNLTVTNLKQHPFLANSTKYSVVVGENANGETVEVWKFAMHNEVQDRDLYTRAYGKLLDLLTLEGSPDKEDRKRAGCYRIRALQLGNQNVVHHFGCRFAPKPNQWSAPEFIVYSEHCKGGNFSQAAGFHLPISVISKWVHEVVRGLDFLHKHGIVHRNLNSTVIFFTEPTFKGTVKIGGFHNMRQLAGEHTQKHEISARRGEDGRFVAPEISSTLAEDLNVGRRCDIWSLGCVVLHLVTGHPPLYRGQSGRVIDSEMAVIYHLNNQKKGPQIPQWVPGNVRSFIEKCLQFQPSSRPTTTDLLMTQHSVLVADGTAAAEYDKNRPGTPLPPDVVSFWTQSN